MITRNNCLRSQSPKAVQFESIFLLHALFSDDIKYNMYIQFIKKLILLDFENPDAYHLICLVTCTGCHQRAIVIYQ